MLTKGGAATVYACRPHPTEGLAWQTRTGEETLQKRQRTTESQQYTRMRHWMPGLQEHKTKSPLACDSVEWNTCPGKRWTKSPTLHITFVRGEGSSRCSRGGGVVFGELLPLEGTAVEAAAGSPPPPAVVVAPLAAAAPTSEAAPSSASAPAAAGLAVFCAAWSRGAESSPSPVSSPVAAAAASVFVAAAAAASPPLPATLSPRRLMNSARVSPAPPLFSEIGLISASPPSCASSSPSGQELCKTTPRPAWAGVHSGLVCTRGNPSSSSSATSPPN